MGDDPGNYLTLNAYDTTSHSLISGFFTGVSGYTTALNHTKGNLAATAYRTRNTDDWNFKYYRYDVRGRVIKLWNIISGFDTLITEYYYNSQDQITKYSHSGKGDVKTYRNIYDYAGRLQKVDYYTGSPDAPDPEYTNLTEYEFNPNTQISIQKYNDAFMYNEYSYNNRNWITSTDNSSKLFEYSNQYFKNGNVKSVQLSGDYSLNFAVPSDLTFVYEYDRSNRLTEAKTSEKNFNVVNTYDKDGNILTLDRNGSTGNSLDDFNYSYYTGTNKLSKVTGSVNQYTYDANGNMTRDDLNKNFDIIYDHRNLIVQLKQLIIDIHGSKNDTTIYQTFYYYDEAGNRIRKMTYDTEDDSLKRDIIYSRDVSGRELAVYENGSIKQWNLFGLDNIGYMTGSDELRFYLKDHLGSVRVVTDDKSSVINCQDYDPWGYILDNRVYKSDESVYKFTSKERDEESEYDYFGARYYDARIGRWGSIDPLLEKHYDFSSYNYVLDNPLIFYDPDGKQVFLGGESFQESKGIGQYIDINETQLNSQRRFDNKRSRFSGFTTTDVGLLDPVEWIAGGFATLSMRLYASWSMTIGEKLVDQALKNIGKSTAYEISKNTAGETVEYALPKLVPELEKQLELHGSKAIFNALKSTEKILNKHVNKLESLKWKSSVEKEIKTFKNQVETINQFIKVKGLK